MRYFLSMFIIVAGLSNALAQTLSSKRDITMGAITPKLEKPAIDLQPETYRWPHLSSPAISDNGRYVMYRFLGLNFSQVIIRNIDNGEEKKIAGAAINTESFSINSRIVFFIKSRDTLGILHLGADEIEYIPCVSSYQLVRDGSHEWLTYKLSSPTEKLVLRDLADNRELQFSSVTTFRFNTSGNVLILQKQEKKDSIAVQVLEWVSLPDGRERRIWQGTKLEDYSFDSDGMQVVIRGQDSPRSVQALWYYNKGMEQAKMLINDSSAAGIAPELTITGSPFFSKDGRRIFFELQQTENRKPLKDVVKLDVWSYTDSKLQPEQLKSQNAPIRYIASISPTAGRVIRLTNQDEQIISSPQTVTGDYVLVQYRSGASTEWNWNPAAQPSVYLVSLQDGSRTLLKSHIKSDLPRYSLSPGGQYVIYCDDTQKAYWSYNVATHVRRKITGNIPRNFLTLKNWDFPGPAPLCGIAGWLVKDSALLIHDQYDIWELDPAGLRPPVNLTHGYGRVHQICFRFLEEGPTTVLNPTDNFLLPAFNTQSKANGFYRLKPGPKEDPELLTMGPHVYYWPGLGLLAGAQGGLAPIKAKNADTWLVCRQSATEAPNYFFTHDFKNFTPVTNIAPQKDYNWLTAEMRYWKTFDGRQGNGILYRPENFDPNKKYPVIFYFYERLTDELNCCLKPEYTHGPLNIPYFVSNGYLVFVPDIHYKIGEPGQSVYNYVVSATRYLSRIFWVDSTRIGIAGHSFGGYEVNYLVTHSHLFAAAVAAAGVSDLVSEYGDIYKSLGQASQYLFETSQNRIGATLCQKPELYIKNSPVFRADQVTTPLLLMNNKQDGAVSFGQGVEFFTALRRMGKKVWLLQYDDEGHSLSYLASQDFTVRLAQFFNHYLKGAPAPEWMLKGLPARWKGFNDGLKSKHER